VRHLYIFSTCCQNQSLLHLHEVGHCDPHSPCDRGKSSRLTALEQNVCGLCIASLHQPKRDLNVLLCPLNRHSPRTLSSGSRSLKAISLHK